MTPTALQNAVIGTVVVLIAVLAAACLMGARKASRANAKKLAKLRELDGQRVRLGLRTVGRDFLLEHTAVPRSARASTRFHWRPTRCGQSQ